MVTILERQRFDLLIVLNREPYTADTLTTVLRLAQAVLRRGQTVSVWACGYNTMLTQVSLGDTKPIDVRDPARSYPSTAAIIRGMLTRYDGRLSWLVCTACSAERGAGRHLQGVRLRSAPRFVSTVRAADRVIYIGGA